MQNEILVSISCITYNHENYIADAIESFLMQKTNFLYEILIHDDASTDRTADIIREYERKYPDLIKPIYQTENQYSKGVNIDRFNNERARGKYIASCEGDDFWTDPYKLQKQVDYTEKHPECSMCIHAVYRVTPDKKKLKSHFRPNIGNKIFTTEEIIEGAGSGCELHISNSILYPTIFSKNEPDFFNNAPVGDYPLAVYLALQGTVYYIDEFMSSYRVNVKGSWTNTILSNSEKAIAHHKKGIDMLDKINLYTGYKYNNTIHNVKKRKLFKLLFTIKLAHGKFKEVNEREFKEFYSVLDTKSKTIIRLAEYFPYILNILRKIKLKHDGWILDK
jgi:glycosyltransferase involved in cell wall biosynthesis